MESKDSGSTRRKSSKVCKILSISVAQMADDNNIPGGFDLCVSILSTDLHVTILFPTLKNADE